MNNWHTPYTRDIDWRCWYCGAVANSSCKECDRTICGLHVASYGAVPKRKEDMFCLECYDKWLQKKQEKK